MNFNSYIKPNNGCREDVIQYDKICLIHDTAAVPF